MAYSNKDIVVLDPRGRRDAFGRCLERARAKAESEEQLFIPKKSLTVYFREEGICVARSVEVWELGAKYRLDGDGNLYRRDTRRGKTYHLTWSMISGSREINQINAQL